MEQRRVIFIKKENKKMNLWCRLFGHLKPLLPCVNSNGMREFCSRCDQGFKTGKAVVEDFERLNKYMQNDFSNEVKSLIKPLLFAKNSMYEYLKGNKK